MARNKPRTVLYRRKRSSKTNYNKRLKLLLSGNLRLVVRFTNQRIIAQVISFGMRGDKVLAGIDSFALKKLGWKLSCKNFPAAYLTGFMLGKKASAAHVKEAVLDTGFKDPSKKGKVYAFLKGVLDAGIDVPHDDSDIFPPEERLFGKHIEEHAKHLKSNNLPKNITSQMEEVKQKLIK